MSKRPRNSSDPVFQDGQGRWWFWDETWSWQHGPYKTEEAADEACLEYAKSL